ncbi:MAG: peptidoglycan DD-metalloendopeptidase family protein [Anaerolineae bacterium]|nr:peptidoglycan DD-metalloendopeptidase family protein [Anaerolineae bacterium]
MATTFYQLTGDWRVWIPLFARTSAHLAVVAVAIVAIGLSDIEWPAKAAFGSPTLALPAAAGDGDNEETAQDVLPKPNGQNGDVLASSRPIARLAQPHTIIPERPRLDIITYTIQAGDTVQYIADLFGLQPTSIMWANPAIEDAPDLLRIGQEVTILPIDGAYHKVAEGDTLESIAEEYKVEPEAIVACEYNPLEAPVSAIQEGTWLIVPGGEKPYVPKVVTTYTGSVPEGARGTGRFQWPVLGRITQGYWYGHRAIDIGASIGSAVMATDGGFISFAGWTDVGYGYLIVIDHANGFATYYAHLSNIYVFTGQAVERGQVIAASGNTGWSTGPHLHFEVRRYAAQQNPRAYLP